MLKASPIVKKLIKQNNIDINNIVGTGPGGRIIKRDLENYNVNLDIDKESIIQSYPKEIIPSQIRKIIATRTSEAFKNIPHFYLKIESNIDKLINLKEKINISNKKNKISLNDLFIKALAIAQSKNLKTCVHWIENKIFQFKSVDISLFEIKQSASKNKIYSVSEYLTP